MRNSWPCHLPMSGKAEYPSSHYLFMSEQTVAIAIPIYRDEPTTDEIVVLRHYLSVFQNYPIVFIAQQDMDVTAYQDLCAEHTSIGFEYFQWKGYEQYNKLMVDAAFYKRFLKYTYILLAQTDTFIFDVRLDYWCKQDYDFIGGVIYNSVYGNHMLEASSTLKLLKKTGLVSKDSFRNGGLSLRKTSSFHTICRRYSFLIRSGKLTGMEDAFWSVWAPLLNPFFKVAPVEVSHQFAVELPSPTDDHLETVYQKLSNQPLPFGCHNWRGLGYSFWKPHIEEKLQVDLDQL